MNYTQIPIITWEKRYMTISECSKLQSMDRLSYLPESKGQAYRAFGNAVNVDVVKHIASSLINADGVASND
jgi:DNA (cytosine-5)-methyltransferase 1